jgi:hypothetical protein
MSGQLVLDPVEHVFQMKHLSSCLCKIVDTLDSEHPEVAYRRKNEPAKDKGDVQLGIKTSSVHRPERKVKWCHDGHEPSIPSALHVGVIKVLQHLAQTECEERHLNCYCVQ